MRSDRRIACTGFDCRDSGKYKAASQRIEENLPRTTAGDDGHGKDQEESIERQTHDVDAQGKIEPSGDEANSDRTYRERKQNDRGRYGDVGRSCG